VKGHQQTAGKPLNAQITLQDQIQETSEPPIEHSVAPRPPSSNSGDTIVVAYPNPTSRSQMSTPRSSEDEHNRYEPTAEGNSLHTEVDLANQLQNNHSSIQLTSHGESRPVDVAMADVSASRSISNRDRQTTGLNAFLDLQTEPVAAPNYSNETFEGVSGANYSMHLPDTMVRNQDLWHFDGNAATLPISDTFYMNQISSEAYMGDLNAWLFEPDSDISPGRPTIPLPALYNADAPSGAASGMPYRQDGTGSPRFRQTRAATTIVSQERAAQVQQYWPSKAKDKSRLPGLWNMLSPDGQNSLLCASEPNRQSSAEGHANEPYTTWGFDQSCWDRTANLLKHFSPPRNLGRSHGRAQAAWTDHTDRQHSAHSPPKMPPLEIFDIALDIFFAQILPAIPVLHVPTFAAKSCSDTLLLAISGLAIKTLNTTGADQFVAQIFSVSPCGYGRFLYL